MKRLPLAFAILFTLPFFSLAEDGFVSIFDGKSFDGWKLTEENPDSFVIEDGAIVTKGPRAHLYYVGDLAPCKNFELKVDVWAETGSNGGIYFHTAYQPEGWPEAGFESQVNVSQKDWRKTGSLYGIVDVAFTPVQDKRWWTQHIIVKGNTVTVYLNDLIVLEYNEPAGAQAGVPYTRVLDQGTFGLQCHDPASEIRYKNIRLKVLPDEG